MGDLLILMARYAALYFGRTSPHPQPLAKICYREDRDPSDSFKKPPDLGVLVCEAFRERSEQRTNKYPEVGGCVAIISGGNVYADVPAAVKQIEQANTATLKTKFYQRRNSKDTKAQTRINDALEHQTREYAYKAPGLYRDVTLDENGQVTQIDINDTIKLKRLFLNPKEMKLTCSVLKILIAL